MPRLAIAYLRPPHDNEAADALIFGCGLEIIEVVREQSVLRSAALGDALAPIAAGRASALVVVKLDAVAGSLRELIALLDWLADVKADLLALDLGLDSASAAGRRTIAALREVERWDREPRPGRPVRGRPGLATLAPELSERIAAMRERGLSLQAIADALNDDGVPTRRGGKQWRPSSVQAALGYRRPRPPLPGAPPPPRHPPAHPPPAGHPPGEGPRSPRRRGPRP